MLGNYEKRYFNSNEKVWFGKYRNLTNILHWHPECELIRIISGNAQIKVGNTLFYAKENDSFFCGAEDLHYIKSEPDAIIEAMIFHKDLLVNVTDKYVLTSPRLVNTLSVKEGFAKIKRTFSEKPCFFAETLENISKEIILDIFNHNDFKINEKKNQISKEIINKIHAEFSYITFEDIVLFSGYSPSHFSKMFKKFTGMNFSEYLNFVKTEYAVTLLKSNKSLTKTEICEQCGFSTIRNFNRVFKNITGFAPNSLPKDFSIDVAFRVSKSGDFDPTVQTSELLKS